MTLARATSCLLSILVALGSLSATTHAETPTTTGPVEVPQAAAAAVGDTGGLDFYVYLDPSGWFSFEDRSVAKTANAWLMRVLGRAGVQSETRDRIAFFIFDNRVRPLGRNGEFGVLEPFSESRLSAALSAYRATPDVTPTDLANVIDQIVARSIPAGSGSGRGAIFLVLSDFAHMPGSSSTGSRGYCKILEEAEGSAAGIHPEVMRAISTVDAVAPAFSNPERRRNALILLRSTSTKVDNGDGTPAALLSDPNAQACFEQLVTNARTLTDNLEERLNAQTLAIEEFAGHEQQVVQHVNAVAQSLRDTTGFEPIQISGITIVRDASGAQKLSFELNASHSRTHRLLRLEVDRVLTDQIPPGVLNLDALIGAKYASPNYEVALTQQNGKVISDSLGVGDSLRARVYYAADVEGAAEQVSNWFQLSFPDPPSIRPVGAELVKGAGSDNRQSTFIRLQWSNPSLRAAQCTQTGFRRSGAVDLFGSRFPVSPGLVLSYAPLSDGAATIELKDTNQAQSNTIRTLVTSGGQTETVCFDPDGNEVGHWDLARVQPGTAEITSAKLDEEGGARSIVLQVRNSGNLPAYPTQLVIYRDRDAISPSGQEDLPRDTTISAGGTSRRLEVPLSPRTYETLISIPEPQIALRLDGGPIGNKTTLERTPVEPLEVDKSGIVFHPNTDHTAYLLDFEVLKNSLAQQILDGIEIMAPGSPPVLLDLPDIAIPPETKRVPVSAAIAKAFGERLLTGPSFKFAVVDRSRTRNPRLYEVLTPSRPSLRLVRAAISTGAAAYEFSIQLVKDYDLPARIAALELLALDPSTASPVPSPARVLIDGLNATLEGRGGVPETVTISVPADETRDAIIKSPEARFFRLRIQDGRGQWSDRLEVRTLPGDPLELDVGKSEMQTGRVEIIGSVYNPRTTGTRILRLRPYANAKNFDRTSADDIQLDAPIDLQPGERISILESISDLAQIEDLVGNILYLAPIEPRTVAEDDYPPAMRAELRLGTLSVRRLAASPHLSTATSFATFIPIELLPPYPAEAEVIATGELERSKTLRPGTSLEVGLARVGTNQLLDRKTFPLASDPAPREFDARFVIARRTTDELLALLSSLQVVVRVIEPSPDGASQVLLTAREQVQTSGLFAWFEMHGALLLNILIVFAVMVTLGQFVVTTTRIFNVAEFRKFWNFVGHLVSFVGINLFTISAGLTTLFSSFAPSALLIWFALTALIVTLTVLRRDVSERFHGALNAILAPGSDPRRFKSVLWIYIAVHLRILGRGAIIGAVFCAPIVLLQWL